MKEALETAAAAGATLLALLALMGAFVKYVAGPWLEKRFAPVANQVRETHHQVTVNGHRSDEPTMLDKLDSLKSEVRELKGETRRDLADVRTDLTSVGRLYDHHLDWSAEETGRLWKRLQELADRLDRDDGNPAATEGEDSERARAPRPAGPDSQRPAGPDAGRPAGPAGD